MKSLKLIAFLILAAMSNNVQAQEQYGNTLNLGAGIGYYGYSGHTLPVVMLNYEFNVANNFTLAPFVGFYTSSRRYRWNKNDYYYHETVIPIGLKGTYYFDNLLNASSKWDFYLAGSVGYALVSARWDDGYYGDPNYYRRTTHLYADLHIGAEWHASQKLGLFLDLSSGVSTFGLAFHK